MKIHLRLICMLCTLCLFAGSVTACGSADVPSAELTITEEFVLTHPAYPTPAESRAVEALRTAFASMGLTIRVQRDDAGDAKHEILVGQTDRPQSQNALTDLGNCEYTVQLTGDAESGYKIVLAASSTGGMDAAAEYFIEQYLTGEKAGTLPQNLLYRYTCTDVAVAGTPISQYILVYAKDGVNLSDPQIQTVSYAETADMVADLIERIAGKRPKVVPDTTRISSDKKLLLFGATALEEDDSAYPDDAYPSAGSYACKLLESGNVILAGKNPCSALAAGEAFADALRNAGEKGLSSLDIAAEKKIYKVACIGDSITYGTNSSDTAIYNYPAYLQKLLGYNYYVEKYGAPSHSLIESDTYSFLTNSYFVDSLDAKPDVVIVMLGTNDCRTQMWEDSAYKDWTNPTRTKNFLAAGEKLIRAYREANADVQIYLATPPTVPQDEWLNTDWTDRIVKYCNPLLAQLAKEQNCQLIDIFTFSEHHPEMFEGGDGLHPQNEQYGILADGVYELVKDTIRKPE